MASYISSRSELIVNHIQQHIYSKIWEGVAEKNVQKMAPKSTNYQNSHTLQSFVYQNFAENYRTMGRIADQRDPKPAKMDNIAAGIIAVEQKQRKIQKSVKQSFLGEGSRSRVSETQIRSMKSNKMSANKQLTTQRQMSEKKESFFISLGCQEEREDKFEGKMRDIENTKTEQQNKIKKQMEEREANRKLTQITKEKLLKDKNHYTYNYEGDLQEISEGKLVNDTVTRMMEQFSKGNVNGRQRKLVEATKIDKQIQFKEQKQASKLKSEEPQFSAKTLSIAEALADISKIAQGVKIVELKNGQESITLQHKAKKLDGLRQYRLTEFKNIAKEKSFVQFSHTSSKRKHTLDYSASEQAMSDLKSKTSLIERNTVKTRGKSQKEIKGRQTEMVLQKALGRGLPFIRTKGLKFNDLGLTQTFRTLQPNSTAKKSSRSNSHRIKIGDISLYEQTFFH